MRRTAAGQTPKCSPDGLTAWNDNANEEVRAREDRRHSFGDGREVVRQFDDRVRRLVGSAWRASRQRPLYNVHAREAVDVPLSEVLSEPRQPAQPVNQISLVHCLSSRSRDGQRHVHRARAQPHMDCWRLHLRARSKHTDCWRPRFVGLQQNRAAATRNCVQLLHERWTTVEPARTCSFAHHFSLCH